MKSSLRHLQQLSLLASLLAFNFVGASAALAHGSQETFDAEELKESINGAQRTAAEKGRDVYRHPLETLEFFGVAPSDTVVEIWPGGRGWYTAILGPYLMHGGTLYAAQFSADSDVKFYRNARARFMDWIKSEPKYYSDVVVTTLQPPKHDKIAPKGSADKVLTFRNVHNWMSAGTQHEVFAAMFKALKPGGILGVVEHRAKPGTQMQAMIDSGYVTEDYVIELAKGAGFELLARSDINNNPADQKNYPRGVWTLPPSLRLGDTDREKYLAIGESDRMTLKFIKPLRGEIKP
ncbi:Uncharacterised protein [BD1-7 clade bacterium]|uniref:Methyltransferase n=1 Tax=BD1-7 clade bacterium TaxID=2029982 RepID=A0A5S9R0P5_9GAMM|nr:Uncharacterised protein [BD1-7 clade bacterium]